MARLTLPELQGEHGVGTVTETLVDQARPASLVAEASGRKLFVKVWYPAAIEPGDPEPLWAQLGNEPVPLPMRWLVGRANSIRTNSKVGAAFSARVENAPVAIYNHGLISFASENTSLAEQLASRGFVVLSIQHVEQLQELRGLRSRESTHKRRRDSALAARLKAASPEHKAAMAQEYYEASTTTSQIVAARSADVTFTLENLEQLIGVIPQARPQGLATESVTLIGFSLGGAVGTEFSKGDDRARAVVNLDGGMHGTRIGEPIRVPYLMMYSSANEGINDALLPDHARRVAPASTAHLNYHEISWLMPALRLVGIIGKTAPRDFIRYRNDTVREFLSTIRSINGGLGAEC